MNQIELKGVVNQVFSNTYKSGTFYYVVVVTDDNYSQWTAEIDPGVYIGAAVHINGYVNAKEWKGKYYNELKIETIKITGGKQEPLFKDDIPF